MRKLHINLLASLLVTFASFSVLAENSTLIPGYTIHHNALSTATLPPEVARVYNIQRSKNRGMLNVSVVEKTSSSLGKSVQADIKVHATNLTGQTRNIPMREVKDGGWFYYIGDFRVADQETLDFVMEVIPPGAPKPYIAEMRQQFFTN